MQCLQSPLINVLSHGDRQRCLKPVLSLFHVVLSCHRAGRLQFDPRQTRGLPLRSHQPSGAPTSYRADTCGPLLAINRFEWPESIRIKKQVFVVLPKVQGHEDVFRRRGISPHFPNLWSASRSGCFSCCASQRESTVPLLENWFYGVRCRDMVTIRTELPCLLRLQPTPKFAEIMAWSFVLTSPYLSMTLWFNDKAVGWTIGGLICRRVDRFIFPPKRPYRLWC